MADIERYDVNEDWVHAGIVKAGDFAFTNYCVGNVGEGIEAQVEGALDDLERRLAILDLDLSSVLKLDCLFRDIWDIPVMEKVFKARFKGTYPARKSIQTEFAHAGGQDGGLLFQLDAVIYTK